MEFHFSRLNVHIPMVLPIVMPMAMILLGEGFLFVGNFDACIILHLLNILVCVMVPLLMRENPIIWQCFSLVSMLRVLNLGMPKFTTMTLEWIPLIYAPVIVVAFLLIRDESLGFKDYVVKMRSFVCLSKERSGWKLYHLPLGLAFALLLANIEFNVLSMTIPDLRMISDMSLENLAFLFVVMVFFVGLGEELVFRYLLQTRVQGTLGVLGAIAVSSIMFAVMHSGYQSLPYLIYVFVVALFLGVSFYRTKSLAYVTLIHGALNFFLFSFLPFGYLRLF
jgi:membrane protease YdiL (CAAX protease family)